MNKDLHEDWLLERVPAYSGNHVVFSALYDSGCLIREYGKEDAAPCKMQGVWSTTEEEVCAYARLLKQRGYREESCLTLEQNTFYRFVKGRQRVYVNYYGQAGRVTIERDDSGAPSAAELSYGYEPKEGQGTEYYMFGLKMDPYGYAVGREENTSGYPDYGAYLVVKCADNSLIVIDGGAKVQMDEAEDRDRLWHFLLEITGKTEGDTLRICAWYVTHFDYDHYTGFPAVLRANPERYQVERVICNLPDWAIAGKDDSWLFYTADTIKDLYPQCQEIKIRTGDVLRLADVTLTMLYTHTDFADETGHYSTTNFNNTSTVAMIESSQGMKMLVTGDIMKKGEAILCRNFSKDTLKCDIFQQPHHNRVDITTLYEYGDAQVMLFTQTVGTLTRDAVETAHSELAKKWCGEWYCGGTETVGFGWSEGKAALIYKKQDIY